MKVSFLFAIGVLLLSGCSTTKQNSSNEHLDLIGNKEAVRDYWVINKKIAPKYPLQAKIKKISGCVEFSLIIGSDGKSISPVIIKAFPEGVFDIQATRAINKWKWLPTVANSNRQPVATTIQHDFIVKNSTNYKEAYKVCKI
jgi:TonB family protein